MEDESVLDRILNGAEEPKDLPLALLQCITNNFSQERKIGQGGFGAVYKGELRNGLIVAVKRIYTNIDKIDVDDKLFHGEFNSLWKTNHQNVVRCLGFCSNTSKIPIKKAGSKEFDLVNVRERLFCFEYISNGSLEKHITDELRGLEWETRYEIITGICNGLCYLHEEQKIVHMDLKPANVLLHGKYMVPKITDFGLSRPDENSHTMAQPIGTRGYIAPEYEKDRKTSPKSDIYSLGAIIFELVTGCMGAPDKNNVLRRWRHRWNKPPTLLQYKQVTGCIEIAVRCRQQEPKDRPSIGDIISFLRKSETTDGHTSQESTYLDDDMLGIEPLELPFNFKIKTEMSWSIKLTNRTKACFAFIIESPRKQYTIWPDKGIVPPECNEYLVQITMQPQERSPQVTQNADKFIVQSTKVRDCLRVEDITEHIFDEEAGKVVDEVALMVVYEPGSRKIGQDPNVPVEAVSPKRKAINYSSYEDGVRGQLDRRNFHLPENFSHSQPTNETYLLRVSDRAMDVTRGAMGSLLHKLGELLKEEFNLETSIKKDIQSLSEELVKMQIVLRKVSEVQQDNLDDLVKRWASNVREMSYDLEDFVDGFLVHSEPTANMGGFRELTHEMCFLLDKGKSHHPISDMMKNISKQVHDEAQKRKEYNVDNVVADAAATITDTIDPRMLVVFEHQKQLVGIKEPRDDLIRMLTVMDGDASGKQLKIFSICGSGGLGKTTLAKAVYDKLEDQFRPMAFVSIGRNPDKKEVLREILDELCNNTSTATLNEKQLIKQLHRLLQNNRYFIVIDDIWDTSAWSIIKYAFPENNCGSRVVTTTRIHSVAVACCNASRKYICEMKTLNDRDSRRLFVSRIFGMEDVCPDVPEDILTVILKKCGGLPLAIISIASLVAKNDPRRRSTWDYVRKSLIAMFEGNNPTLRDMEQILDLSYRHLPNHLKTCLLSVGKYREDQEIEKDELLRQWMAEGFVSTISGLDAEDVAQNYFNELINMSMIQPVKIDYNDEVLSCRVHDIMLDLIRSKATEENFCLVIDGSKEVTEATKTVRRVSFHYHGREVDRILSATVSKSGSLSHVRSVLLLRGYIVRSFLELKYVRVLHLEDDISSHLDLTSISGLFLLRYLKIISSAYFFDLKLPSRFEELQQLETIDVQPARYIPHGIVNLPRLLHLNVGTGAVLPEGIGRLKSLRTLGGFNLAAQSVDNIKCLGELTNLRDLTICWLNQSEPVDAGIRMDVFRSSIESLSGSLRSLNIGVLCNIQLPVHGWSSTHSPPARNLRKLDLTGCDFERCPKWIAELGDLYSLRIRVREVADGVGIVARLPSLAYFFLDCHGEKEETAVFSGFRALKHLDLDCKKLSLTFEDGAMPRLEKLEIWFRYNISFITRQFLPIGIEHLPARTLREIRLKVVETFEQYKPLVRHMIQSAFEPHHPFANITIYFHDMISQRGWYPPHSCLS